MKTLSTLALLTAATAAQAYTLDVNVGHSRLSNTYDDVSLIGLGVGSQLNNEFHLGLNVSRKSIYDMNVALVDAKATSATLDLTYSLSPMGGIRPFVGAGVGYSWLSGTGVTSKSVLTTDVFAGVRFALSENLDIAFTVKNAQFSGVKYTSGAKHTITDWSQSVGLRLKF